MAYAPPNAPDWRVVRGLLASHRFPHRDLARRSGLSEGTISRWLCGRLVLGEAAILRIRHGLEELGLTEVLSIAPDDNNVEEGTDEK